MQEHHHRPITPKALIRDPHAVVRSYVRLLLLRIHLRSGSRCNGVVLLISQDVLLPINHSPLRKHSAHKTRFRNKTASNGKAGQALSKDLL